MPIRALAVAIDDVDALRQLAEVAASAPELAEVAIVAIGPTPAPGDGRWWSFDPVAAGVPADAAEVVGVAAGLVGAFPRDVAVAATDGHPLLTAGRAVGVGCVVLPGAAPVDRCRSVLIDGFAALRADEDAVRGAVGVGPHPAPWPDDPRLDPALLAVGDRRNVVDRYRYWREDAIVADLDARRHPLHVAVENWRHDLNIGTVVRNANAFNVAGVHIVGARRWNRRGAMATDRYLHVHHHETVADLAAWAGEHALPIVGIDNVPGARDLDASPLPSPAVVLLGQEGPGLSDDALDACTEVVAIGQHGSTRSLNAGVASGIVLHAWVRQHATEAPRWPERPPVP